LLVCLLAVGVEASGAGVQPKGDNAVNSQQVLLPGQTVDAAVIEGMGVLREFYLEVTAPKETRAKLTLSFYRNGAQKPEWSSSLLPVLVPKLGALDDKAIVEMPLRFIYLRGARFVLHNDAAEAIPFVLRVSYEERDPSQAFETAYLRKHVNGAILAEDWANAKLDTNLWREWIMDTQLQLQSLNGTFRIAGTTGGPTQPGNKGFRFTGLVSNTRRSCDAVLVTRMRVPQGISSVPGMERNIVHLCGSSPDHFLEVVYGKDASGRKGWFQYVNNHLGHFFDSPPTLPDESAAEFRDVKIEYSHTHRTAQGFLRTAAGWQPVGEPAPLSLTTMKVETKVNCPLDGVPIQAEFQQCRLYPQPSTSPVELLVVRWPAPHFACAGLKLRVTESESKQMLAEAVTDQWGMIRFTLPNTWVYPVGALVELFQGDKKIAEGTIKAEGVEGLYPGDLWGLVLSELAIVRENTVK
jgi:hypothetical protein